ncbi:DUF3098 domain-containing protein [Membranihabitans marinus]|uniref:DUF3098 domain-containing protein n=1 Tax=Membranihabitans marinus TaxID=1227546 RepID=UPI001F203163|nr:DUF3098 domain-containing protein [Membranihabitans marinus]
MTSQANKKVIKKKAVKARKAPVRTVETKSKNSFTQYEDFIFTKQQYIYSGIGMIAIILGMILMSGGHMPDDNTWDPNIIYSFTRITLAPIFILAGLVLQVFAIFKK